jgi:hypothetical protein
VGNRGFSAHGAESRTPLIALGTEKMLISFVICSLIVQNMSGRDMSSHVMP